MRIRQLMLHDALALLPFSLGTAALISAAMVTAKSLIDPAFSSGAVVNELAAGALGVAIAVWWLLRTRPVSVPAWMNARGATAWILALQLGILLLPVPVFALVKHVAADDLRWSWPYLNKRWLVTLFALTIGTFVVFPVAFDWLRSGSGTPADVPDSAPRPSRAARTPLRTTIAALVGAALLAWYFGGPPWHISRHHREIESHEQAHLGALQAISRGYLPYIGPASTQYGPGSQQFLYAMMQRSGHFDIVSFRTAWAAMNFAALFVVACAAALWLDLPSAAAVIVLAVIYSPLSFFGTAPDGTLRGFYGWANGLRYIAPLIVVPSLVPASGVASGTARVRTAWIVLLGIVWGLCSWMSQENLTSTAIAAGLLLTVLLFTRTVEPGAALRIAGALAIGFALAAAAVLTYYARHDAVGPFLTNYFFVPRAVAAGYSNTWWPAGSSGTRTFYLLAPFMLALTIATVWRLPSLKLGAPLDAERARFLAFVLVQLVCFQTALLRSDPGHLQNTTLALPFVLVLGVAALPRWMASPSLSRSTVRWTLIVVALAILPAGRLLQAREILLTPATRFLSSDPVAPSAAPDPRVGYARATPMLADEPLAIGLGTLTMREWLDFASEVHDIVGGRKTFVADAGEMWTGPLYFFADLTPAPVPLEGDTMVANDVQRTEVAAHIRAHPADYQCFIGSSLDTEAARAFLAGHPAAERVERNLGQSRLHILLAPVDH
jgi:hypothetical protein